MMIEDRKFNRFDLFLPGGKIAATVLVDAVDRDEAEIMFINLAAMIEEYIDT